MSAKVSVAVLRQRWDEARQLGQSLSVDELCDSCPELRDEVCQQFAQWHLDAARHSTSDDHAGADSGPLSGSSSSPALDAAITVVLQAGAEPVPGYRLVDRLGKGGYGEVWMALGPGQVPVALKFIELHGIAHQQEERALELMRQLRHANLLTIAAHWQTESQLIIAMELADGTLLDRFYECLAEGLPGIPAKELQEFMAEAAKGIDFLNEPRHTLDGKSGVSIQHRDIKPANLLVVGGSVKVGDFGLVKLLENTRASHTGNLTVGYAAPECFGGQVHRLSDQYSLAITYTEMRTGLLPFRGTLEQITLGHLNEAPDLESLPEPERSVVARALAKDPEDRWPNCRTFVAELAAGEPQPAPPRPKSRVLPRRKRTRWLRWVGGAMLLGLGCLLPLLWRSPQGPLAKEPTGEWEQKTSAATLKNAPPRPTGTKTAPPKESLPKAVENSLGMKLVLVPAGKFRMGSPEQEEDRRRNEGEREVVIGAPFYMGRYEVTQAQYRKVMGENPSYFAAAGEGKERVQGQDTSDFPVEWVSWLDAVQFCARLSDLPGEKRAGRVYHLPTEAEWEYACRGGQTAPFHYGPALSSALANFNGNHPYGGAPKGVSKGRTEKVGSYQPNAFGLYDMHGNVWEWCADEYAESPSGRVAGGEGDGKSRVLRGGSWYDFGHYCRAASRLDGGPGLRSYSVGFRVVWRPAPKAP
jgi:formylglycine-generating enzyme required for sulfatase activity